MAEQTSDLLGLIDDMDRLLRELNRRLSLPEGVQKSTYTKAGLENVRVRWYVLKGYLIAVEPLIEYRRKPPLLLNADYYIPSRAAPKLSLWQRFVESVRALRRAS